MSRYLDQSCTIVIHKFIVAVLYELHHIKIMWIWKSTKKAHKGNLNNVKPHRNLLNHSRKHQNINSTNGMSPPLTLQNDPSQHYSRLGSARSRTKTPMLLQLEAQSDQVQQAAPQKRAAQGGRSSARLQFCVSTYLIQIDEN